MVDQTSLSEVVTACHRTLDEFFLVHQEAVLVGRLGRAARLLECFCDLHGLHMEFEDRYLIPILDDCPGRWSAKLYSGEHDKIGKLLARTIDDLSALSARPLSGRPLRRALISFIDGEKTLKGLCEHHQEREEKGMLPELDTHTDTGWRRSVIEPFLAAWCIAVERNGALLDARLFAEPGLTDQPCRPGR